MTPNIFIIHGRMGSGKTHFAKNWLGHREKVLFTDFPKFINEEMKLGDVFSENDIVVVDEMMGFEKNSTKKTIERLVAESNETGKKLVLLVQDLGTFSDIGINLPKNAAYAQTSVNPATALDFKFTVSI